MANVVKIPYSNTSGNTPSSLANGVLAINQTDGKLFYRNGSGVVTSFAPPATIADGYAYDCGAYAAIAPAAPTGLSVTASAGQAALSWTAPTNTGGVALTDYTIQYSSNSGSSYTTFSHSASTATSATITSLATGSYLFRVAAVNSVGTGSYVTSSSTSISGASSLIAIARDNGTSSFSGSGTTASPFSRVAGIYLDAADGLSHYTWTASGTATVTLGWTHTDDDGNGNFSIIKKNGTIVHTGLANGTFSRTVSVVSGDVITFTANYLVYQMFSNVTVSAA
jgi:Fibronectin type III domain